MSIRMRHTRGHSGNRRSHHALKNRVILTDKESGNLRLPHHLDEKAGTYRGKLIVPARVKQTKEQRAKSAKLTERDHAQVHEHEKAEAKLGSKGLIGKLTGGAKPKARSGAGGGGV